MPPKKAQKKSRSFYRCNLRVCQVKCVSSFLHLICTDSGAAFGRTDVSARYSGGQVSVRQVQKGFGVGIPVVAGKVGNGCPDAGGADFLHVGNGAQRGKMGSIVRYQRR